MKKIFLVFLLALGVFSRSVAQLQRDMQKGSTLTLKKGSVLVYGVDFYGTSYDYSIQNAVTGKEEKDIAYFHAASADGKTQYWIHFSNNNRLILKMDLGWKIWLKELK